MTFTYNSFIYIWYNSFLKKFYIGKHFGLVEDNYICSSKAMNVDYKENPQHFKRRILQYLNDQNGNDSLAAELRWLSMIKEQDLGHKYYNLKNKNFGNTRGCKKSYVWNQGLSKFEQEEYINLRKNKLFCLLSEKPKKGMIFKPIVEYRCPHCFTTFYSNKIRKFCSRACTAKWSMLNGARDKISKSRMGIQAWNKGITNPTSAKNGQNSAKKQSATVTGRKIAIINGKRTWIYPDKFFIHNLNGLT